MYFRLNLAKCSPLSEKDCTSRIEYVLNLFALRGKQVIAFEQSIRDILVGVSLILGPSSTGKARVSAAIIIAITACELKLLIAAGSN